MANLTQNQTFTTTVTAAQLNDIAGTATVTNIANTDVAAAADIADTKLATISTAGKVNLTALVATGQATGDILYYSGTAWVLLPAGAAGKFLIMGASIPAWTTHP